MFKKNTIASSNPDYWESAYKANEMGWVLGGPTPVFKSWIKKYKSKLSICVLGAGNGWDALYLAKQGHQVVAVDFAKSAIININKTAKKNNISLTTHHMNIFDLNKLYLNYFDVVLEYTCFCAIDPLDRRKYLEVVRNILKQYGELVGMLFPVDKDPNDGGPPFGVELQTTILLISEYFKCIKKEFSPLSIKPRLGREVFITFQKK